MKKNKTEVSIIPRPTMIEQREGTFQLNSDSIVLIGDDSPELTWVAESLLDIVSDVGNLTLQVYYGGIEEISCDAIILSLNCSNARLGAEGYELSVNEGRILITANEPAGLFYGVQTLKQLIISEGQFGTVFLELPFVEIRDWPRFQWRGMHFDVSRHFYDKDFIKTYIDYLAELKLNVFHWHLTDDQGWRLEITKHPRLAEISAWRKLEGQNYGGYYTQSDIREILDYARRKFITVVPEIEMPGHAQAVLAAYPELSCTGGPYEVWDDYGISKESFCAGNEKVFEFLQDVLEEVVDLFPGRYIHVGGDECIKLRWANCSLCQQRILEEGLSDECELQSYFMSRINDFLTSKGRTMIGWDEILDGNLTPGTVVMSWRGVEGGQKAAKCGYNVVMTPKNNVYFNYKHKKNDLGPGHAECTSLENVYALDPACGLTADEAKNVLGTQACLWTEYVVTPAEVEFMLFPRILALSEVAWTAQEFRQLDDFLYRVSCTIAKKEELYINNSSLEKKKSH